MKKGKHLGIRIDEELHYKMQYIAAYEDRSLNGEVPPSNPKEKIRPVCPQSQSGKSVFFCG